MAGTLSVNGQAPARKGAPVTPDSGSITTFPGDGSTCIGGEHTHDPTIVRFGQTYVCFSTSGGGFGLVRKSSDLKTWKDCGAILPKMPDWICEKYPNAHSVWAPDILVVGKQVRCYYCVSKQFGSNSSVIGMAVNDSFDPQKPTEGWEDKGLLIESVAGTDSFNAIDPETIIDDAGRHWMFYGSYWAGIFVIELDPASGKVKAGAKPELAAINNTERGNPLEGAAVTHRGGYYYLFVSYGLAGQGVRSTYRIMVGRSKTANGPYVDATGKPMAEGGHVEVLKTSPPMFSPGHCDVFKDADGRYLMPYHYYDGRRHWNRDLWGLPQLQVRELLWTDDGWPLPGLPVQFDNPVKGKVASPVGKWVHQADFAQPMQIEILAGGKVKASGSNGTWTLKNGKIVFNWTRDDWPDRVWVDTVQLAYEGKYYVGCNDTGMIIRGIRVEDKK